METWGIMTALTMLGVLVLLVASRTTDDSVTSTAALQPPIEAASAASEFKEAA